MSMRSQTQTKTTPKPSFTPVKTGLLQRKCACGNSASLTGKCTECENKRLTLQRRSTNQAEPDEVPPIVHEVLSSSGQPLDADTRAFMESRFGHDFNQVRVHTDGKAAESAQAVNALAYTLNQNIVFNAGQYNPKTTVGKKQLAHELAHVVQQDKTNSTLTGIAPADSIAEQQADLVASSVLTSSDKVSPTESITNFRPWSPVWQLHPQRITRRGTVAHSGTIGPAAPAQGPPVGSVEVRTGEEVELRPGTSIPNLIAIEYTGSLSAGSRWLQFVWFEMTATTASGIARLNGSIPTSSGTKPFTTNPGSPSWSVDSASTADPFYEAAFLSIRSPSATTIFDAPGGSSATSLAQAVFNAGIGAQFVLFTAHFETYLIQNNQAVYVVPWSASTGFIQVPLLGTVAGAIGYSVGAAGQTTGLPTNLSSILHSQYSAFTQVR